MGREGKNIRLNLFDLHDPSDDYSVRHCLRAFTVLPRYCGFEDERNIGAARINELLRLIGRKARRRFGICWKMIWISYIGFGLKRSTADGWIAGKSAVPLIALYRLTEMGFESEVADIMANVTHVSSTTRDIIKVPKTLSPEILYLTGILLSDGYLQRTKRIIHSNHEFGVHLYSGDKEVLKNHVIPMFQAAFGCGDVKLAYRGNVWVVPFRNKTIFRFFTRIMGIPYGKKSRDCGIPRIVRNLEGHDAIPFLAGMIDGDIGKHGGGMGGSFRSERIVDDMIKFLSVLGIKAMKEKTNILKTGHIQNGFRIPKSQVGILKEVMANRFLPKRKDRLHTLFCRGTKAV